MKDTIRQALSKGRLDTDLPRLVRAGGAVFREFLRQDSGCVAFGFEDAGGRWFLKTHTDDPGGRESLARAEALHAAIKHPALVPLLGAFDTASARVLVYPWVDGEVLYHPAEGPTGAAGRDHPASAHARFRSLPATHRDAAIEAILDAHDAIAARGFVAVDLYDGCFLYDFAERRMRLIDLDEYRPGPFRVPSERLPGSRRFMAPEEHVPGGLIDPRTTVFQLGRTIQVLSTAPDGSWLGTAETRALAARACRPEAADRWQSVRRLVRAWRSRGG